MFFFAACGGGTSSSSESYNQECTPGEFECIGSESYYCNSLASWVYDARCENGCNSSTGKCYSDSGDSSADLKCSDEGSFRCYNDKIRQKCVSGTWTNFENCEYVCNSTTKQCEDEKGCKSGEYKCIGKNSHYCSNDFWELNEKCTYDCDYNTGKCKDSECTTGEYLCGESTDSEHQYASYYCSEGYWTYNKTCSGECNKSTGKCKECSSGEYKCSDSYSYSCSNSFWDSGTYCGNGCDSSTGKCKEINCATASGKTWTDKTSLKWQDAKDYCDNLTACGYSDWHMPTISELRTLIQNCPATQTGGECGVTDSCLSNECGNISTCSSCEGDISSKYSKLGDDYDVNLWSSSVRSDNSDAVWYVGFVNGGVYSAPKSNSNYVRCVR